MKFLDILKLSFHSIFHNKIRTFITVIIVFVVSLLIMVISIVGLSFYTSINSAYIDMYDLTGATFELREYSYSTDTNNTWRGITESEYDIVMDEFANSPELVDNVVMNGGNLNPYYLYDLDTKPTQTELEDLFLSYDFYSKYSDTHMQAQVVSAWGDLDIKSQGISYLKAGRLWDRDDEGLNKVWVSESFISTAASYGKYLGEGDYVVLSFISYINTADEYTEVRNVERFKISGILLNSALEELDYQTEIFLEVKTAFGILDDSMNFNSLTVVSEPKFSYNFESEYNKMNTISKNINAEIEPSIHRNREEDRFSCDLVDNLKMVRIIGSVMIGASFFICFIILIISIGSVANSIIISVDKNRRFLGVMMAVGLKDRGVKKIVQFEALIMIILATGLAYGILTLFKEYFMPIIDFLMTLPGFTDNSIVVLPVYVPIITILGFVGMALLFARKSLNSIIDMDIISVISEVA